MKLVPSKILITNASKLRIYPGKIPCYKYKKYDITYTNYNYAVVFTYNDFKMSSVLHIAFDVCRINVVLFPLVQLAVQAKLGINDACVFVRISLSGKSTNWKEHLTQRITLTCS